MTQYMRSTLTISIPQEISAGLAAFAKRYRVPVFRKFLILLRVMTAGN